MKDRSFLLLFFAALAAVLSACGGGSASSGGVAAGNCDGDQGLCVTSCNLGCGPTGCSISDIAVNQSLVFSFNQELDPTSVNRTTFQLATASGKEPVGTYVVQKNNVIFVPDIQVVGTEVFFGFQDQATYVLTIPNAAQSLETIRSKSGRQIAQGFSCVLNVTRGIVDFDGRAPEAYLVVPDPSKVDAAPRDTLIIVEFSELVDTSSLIQSNYYTTGVGLHFRVAKRAKNGECALEDFRLEGTWTVQLNEATQRTRVIFRPSELLPGNSCVVVRLNDKPNEVEAFRLVRDLKGNPASPARLEFGTEAASVEEFSVLEDFDDPLTTRDAQRDGFTWAKEAAVPSKLGGSGVLGDLTVANAAAYKSGVKITGYDKNNVPIAVEIDAGNVIVPNYLTLSGVEQGAPGGILEFTSIKIDDGESITFVGTTPPQLEATGQVLIEGTLSVSAPDAVVPQPVGSSGPNVGQAGQPGGPGGAKGGQGGSKPFLGATIGQIDGLPGEAVVLPAGHPLSAAVAGTGGRGSLAHPQPDATSTNLPAYNTKVTFTAISGIICQQVSAGGGGASFVTAGTKGETVRNPAGSAGQPQPGDFGAPCDPGATVDISGLFTRTESAGFLYGFGGAGGGGAGVNPMGSFSSTPVSWSSGSGGTGGGGFVWIKSGGDFVLGNRGKILSRGGNGKNYELNLVGSFGPGAPGAGSGGSVLVQSGGLVDLRGEVNVLGGSGGVLSAATPLAYGLQPESHGGDGGAGFVRVEADPAPDYRSFLNFRPAASAGNAGQLKAIDHDAHALLFTKWYRTGLVFPPTYTAYVVKAKIGTQALVFSDDPKRSSVPADGTQAVTIFLQGGQADGNEIRNPSPWYTGEIDPLNLRGGNAFRFGVRIDRTKAGAPIEIQSVQIFYQS